MGYLWCLPVLISVASAATLTRFHLVFKSEWVRDQSPRHQLMINGTHPVVVLGEKENRTCQMCPEMYRLHAEYTFFQVQGRYLQNLGDKWRTVNRATIVHTCAFLRPGFICDTETLTNRGHLTVSRTKNVVFGRGNFLHLLDSMRAVGLQYLAEHHEMISIHWRNSLETMKARSQPARVWVNLLRDSTKKTVGCSAYCSSPFPISVSLVGKNGAVVYGSEIWSLTAVNASVNSNDLAFNHCRVESILGWSVALTQIPEGFHTMQLLEHDERQERNQWEEETIVVKVPHRNPPIGEPSFSGSLNQGQWISPWTIFCSSAVVVSIIGVSATMFIFMYREIRNGRREDDPENSHTEYIRL